MRQRELEDQLMAQSLNMMDQQRELDDHLLAQRMSEQEIAQFIETHSKIDPEVSSVPWYFGSTLVTEPFP